MDEREMSRKIAEIFTQLSEENKTRLEDIATGMRIQKEIDERKDGESRRGLWHGALTPKATV